jgi:hypothetical protein
VVLFGGNKCSKNERSFAHESGRKKAAAAGKKGKRKGGRKQEIK